MHTVYDVAIVVNLKFYILPFPPHSKSQIQNNQSWELALICPIMDLRNFNHPASPCLVWHKLLPKAWVVSWNIKKVYFLYMTMELGEYGCLVEIILESLLGTLKKIPSVGLMIYSGGWGKWGSERWGCFQPYLYGDYWQDMFCLCNGL